MKRKLLFFFTLLQCMASHVWAAETADVKLNTVVMTQYTTQNGVGQYIMLLSTGDYTVDEDLGIYRTSDDGYMATITLYGAASANADVSLPDGTYNMGGSTEAGTWTNAEGLNVFTQYTKATNTTNSMAPTAGKLTVAHEEGQTVITGSLTANNTTYNIEYKGALNFQGETADNHVKDPVNTTFIGGQALYIGDEFGYGMARIELWDKDSNEEGTFPDGTNLLKTVIYVPKINYATQTFNSLPTGTYEVGYSAGDHVALPGYDDGESIPTGSYVVVNEGQLSLLGMIDAGTFDIQEENGVYTFTANFTTAEGVSVKGTYTGRLDFQDISGGGDSWVSTLTEDKTLDYSSVKTVPCRNFGDVYQQGVRSIDLRWIDTEKLVGTTVEMLLPMDNEFKGVPTGTFPVGAVGEYKANTLFPGTVLGGYIIGSWGHQKYGYTEDGQLGIDMNDVGPAAAGSVTIAKNGEDYTVTFDLEDDANPAHKMTGSWTGRIVMETDGIDNVAKSAQKLRIEGQQLWASSITKPVEMSIYDSAGQLVTRVDAWNGKGFSIANLSKGMYVVKVGTEVYKIVK